MVVSTHTKKEGNLSLSKLSKLPNFQEERKFGEREHLKIYQIRVDRSRRNIVHENKFVDEEVSAFVSQKKVLAAVLGRAGGSNTYLDYESINSNGNLSVKKKLME